jgi:hypothetical protein
VSSLQGCLSFLITGRGEFRAQTQVALNAMRLPAAEERLSRIASVAVPADAVMIMFPIGKAVAPACAGLKMQMPPRAAVREYPITASRQRDSIDLDQRKGSVAVRRRLAGQCQNSSHKIGAVAAAETDSTIA